MIDRKTFWIGVMTIVAALLLTAHAMQPGPLMPQALAQEVIDHRDYAMASAETSAGGEILYILDKRSGVLALVVWNNQTGLPELRQVHNLSDEFRPR